MPNIKLYDEYNKAHGEWFLYYNNGQLEYHWNFFHGIRHGLQEGFYYDGTLWFRGYRNMGTQIGHYYNSYSLQKCYYLCLI